MSQTIKLDKKEIDDTIKYHQFNEYNAMLNIKWPIMIIPETAIHNIKKTIKSALSEINHSWEGTYVFLCQDNDAFLYGLYKGEDTKIYLVKSFMNSIVLVVKFDRKMLHRP
jgi:apolipoprotein N-acyltransferase